MSNPSGRNRVKLSLFQHSTADEIVYLRGVAKRAPEMARDILKGYIKGTKKRSVWSQNIKGGILDIDREAVLAEAKRLLAVIEA